MSTPYEISMIKQSMSEQQNPKPLGGASGIIKNNPDEYVTIGKIQDRRHKEYVAKQQAARLVHSVYLKLGDRKPIEVVEQTMEIIVAALMEAEERGESKAKYRAAHALEAENKRLREALKPFADVRSYIIDSKEYADEWAVHCSVEAGHFRRARAALKGDP